MREDGSYTDDEKATIFSTGAWGIPSFLGTHYQRLRYRPHPTALLAWLFAFASFLLFFFAFIAVPLAVHAARRGNRLAWGAVVLALVAAPLSFVLPG